MLQYVMSVSQFAPGAPLKVRVTESTRDSLVDNQPLYVVLGVTTSTVPPATLSDFLHYEGGSQNSFYDPYWDSYQASYTYKGEGGVTAPNQSPFNSVNAVTQHVTTDFAAGRYLWSVAFFFLPSPSSAPDAVSLPYLIQ